MKTRTSNRPALCWTAVNGSTCLCYECWSCKRKTRYDNPLLALQSARLASFRAKELIKDYKCRYCDGYHIGRVHRGI